MSGKFGLGSSDRPNFESSFLISQQKSLRLRHLTQIAACNINSRGKCLPLKGIELQNDMTDVTPKKYGYFFTLAIKTNNILYTSELVNDSNPCWKPFDFDILLPPPILSVKGCIIRIWLKDEEGEETIILCWGVHFSGLVPIGQNFFNVSPHMAPDTVLFRIKDMFYTSPDCRFRNKLPDGTQTLIPMYHTMSLPSSEVKAGSSVSSMCRLHSLKRSKSILQQKIDDLREDSEHVGISATSDKNILLTKVERSRLMVSVLTERLEREISKLRTLRNLDDQIVNEMQEKSMHILDHYHAFNRELSRFQKCEEQLESRGLRLQEVVSKVHQRRIYLLRQLPIIFPITHDPIHKDKMYICNVHLPEAEHYGTVKDSSLNVALGFVAQLLVTVSNLLNIPLTFPVTFFGSTSSLTDWIAVQPQVKNSFPLHSRGKEKIFFDCAVFLLNKNIAQLRLNCGLPTPNLRPTLFNIWTLLNAICNPESPAIIPDVVLKSPLRPISLEEILGVANIPSISDNNDLPVSKTSWLKDNHSNYSRRYEYWKASNYFDIYRKSIHIERSCSLDSGLHLLRKQQNSTFVQLDSLRRTRSCPINEEELQQYDLDDDLIPAPQIQPKKPAYIDGLNESDRETIDASFELIKNKYFLKRSSSEDRLHSLNTTVASPRSSRVTNPDTGSPINGVKLLDNEESANPPTGVEAKMSENLTVQPEVPPEENVLPKEPSKPDPLLEVFSRTSALANQNFTFKFSNRKYNNS